MKKILDLSLRYKLPLWGALLIVVTAMVVTTYLLTEAYDELEEDMHSHAGVLSRSLATNLFPAMLHDDVWRAIEIIRAPLEDHHAESLIKAESIIVVDRSLRVYATTHPATLPLLAETRLLGDEFAEVTEHIGLLDDRGSDAVEFSKSKRIYFLTPIAEGGARLGTLVVIGRTDVVLPRFSEILLHGAVAGLVILAVLLPLSWYWGQRMTQPLVQLTARMGELSGNHVPAHLDPGLYAHHDELGQLFIAYNQMVHELQAKDELEKQMVQAERLAALGQLAAGVAHEINNPLGGMLTAIDTLKHHTAESDPRTQKTIALIERGLGQIRDTVSALLVEARLKSRSLAPQDIEDVRTLIGPQVRKKALRILWRNGIDQDVPLPATLVRQILINLLLNAVKAASEHGDVTMETLVAEGQLRIVVTNDGKVLTDEQMSHLFEPFSPLSESGHGLGLWVTYQIVHQLGGHIGAAVEAEHMTFTVTLPLGDAA